ncbi:MAG: hypothetical protein HZA80_01435 [Candidatus Taylorbacteria bacterium]|nr:hypothetical protein [Candidatus Taylorbacteria bacterium]
MHPEFIFEGKKYISAKSASLLTGYTSDYIGQLCRGSKIDSRRVGRVWFVAEQDILNYEKNVRTLDQKISVPSQPVAQPLNVHEVMVRKIDSEKTTPPTTNTIQEKSSSHHISFPIPKISPAALMVAVGVFTFVLLSIVALPSYLTSSESQTLSEVRTSPTPTVATSNIEVIRTPAGVTPSSQVGLVANVVVPIVTLVNRLALIEYAALSPLFGGEPVCHSANDYCMSNGTYQGMVVVASSGDVVTDTQVKTTVQENFSDEVKIWSDDTGVSGVIQPVFKKETNDKYMYVVVPVKK